MMVPAARSSPSRGVAVVVWALLGLGCSVGADDSVSDVDPAREVAEVPDTPEASAADMGPAESDVQSMGEDAIADVTLPDAGPVEVVAPEVSAPSCGELSLGPGDYDRTISVASGPPRYYHVHVPPSGPLGTAMPVVFVLHGYFDPWQRVRIVSRMNDVADERGFIAVYPEGRDETWNAGTCCGFAAHTATEDVTFMSTVLDEVQASWCVDPKRVHAAGLSNGGMMALRLGCELSERIASVASVRGNLGVEACAPSRPVPVWILPATADDALAPYSSTSEVTLGALLAGNGCAGASPEVVFTQGAASCSEHPACGASGVVRACVSGEAANDWPGGTNWFTRETPESDLDASSAIADFFAAHPLP
jgi:polyhydroxybutyrate depolymerase